VAPIVCNSEKKKMKGIKLIRIALPLSLSKSVMRDVGELNQHSNSSLSSARLGTVVAGQEEGGREG
jgi:hypothetical protein